MINEDFPRLVNAIIEVPKGSRNKYEYDEASGQIKLDRVLFSSVHYPADYGFVTGTLAEDGDAVDILIMLEEPTFSGCLIEARPIGMLRMEDDKGIDNKVLAVPVSDPRWGSCTDISGISSHLLDEIENFFLTYKKLEAKEVSSDGWENALSAQAYLDSHRIQD